MFRNSNEATMIVKYILSKLDFQTYSLMNSKSPSNEEQNDKIATRIQSELTSYIDTLKQIPTIMRKIAPTSKSESYRLLKFENFQSFQTESHLTDLLLASLIID
jgi:alanyl-tRNA synthetase